MLGSKQSSRVKFTGIVVLSFAICLWSGCGGGMNVGASGATSNGVKITPTSSTRRAGATIQFAAAVTGNTNQTVMYHAPLSVPAPNMVQVQAVSVADKTLTASSPVTLENPVPVPQSVSPTLLPVGNFSLSVGGSNFAPGAKVIFGGTALATTVVSRTQLTATGTTTQAQKGTVKISVENPDPGKVSSTASLNVQVGAAGQVTVSVVPDTVQLHLAIPLASRLQ